jgi:hypothetical protein
METAQIPLLLLLALAATGAPAAPSAVAMPGPSVDGSAAPLDSLALTVRQLLAVDAALPAVAPGRLAQWYNWSNWSNHSCISGSWKNC